MKTSNISYLRNHLSEVLSCVREGETVLVLDRDKPIACLSPYATREDALPERLRQLQSQGFLTHTQVEKEPVLPTPLALSKPVDLVRMILEDREEG
jgi:prevent-host-death family protein